MNRRTFFSFLSALGAACVLPRWALGWRGAPKLWGDGVHDDTAALQWRLDHGVAIDGGTYRLDGTLHIWPTTTGKLYNANLTRPVYSPRYMMEYHNATGTPPAVDYLRIVQAK